jgi:hypothetical protein
MIETAWTEDSSSKKKAHWGTKALDLLSARYDVAVPFIIVVMKAMTSGAVNIPQFLSFSTLGIRILFRLNPIKMISRS